MPVSTNRLSTRTTVIPGELGKVFHNHAVDFAAHHIWKFSRLASVKEPPVVVSILQQEVFFHCPFWEGNSQQANGFDLLGTLFVDNTTQHLLPAPQPFQRLHRGIL